MGQRLNIEIWNNGKVLANAYYHWSAYTKDAACLVDKALEYIKNNQISDGNELLYAIRILEATGAGLTNGVIEHAKNLSVLNGATFAECNGRSEGLIGISDKEISETRLWQEGSVYIFIDEKRVSFRVFFTERIWEWEKSQREEYENEKASANALDIVSINFDDIKFDAWTDCYDFLSSREEPFVSAMERCEVVTPIW